MEKHTGNIIISPRITEKAAYLAERGAYVFNITEHASKSDVARAIRALYNVTPRKVTVVHIPRKSVVTRGSSSARRGGFKSGGKKAYVYLKTGETIDII